MSVCVCVCTCRLGISTHNIASPFLFSWPSLARQNQNSFARETRSCFYSLFPIKHTPRRQIANSFAREPRLHFVFPLFSSNTHLADKLQTFSRGKIRVAVLAVLSAEEVLYEFKSRCRFHRLAHLYTHTHPHTHTHAHTHLNIGDMGLAKVLFAREFFDTLFFQKVGDEFEFKPRSGFQLLAHLHTHTYSLPHTSTHTHILSSSRKVWNSQFQ